MVHSLDSLCSWKTRLLYKQTKSDREGISFEEALSEFIRSTANNTPSLSPCLEKRRKEKSEASEATSAFE